MWNLKFITRGLNEELSKTLKEYQDKEKSDNETSKLLQT